MKKFFIALAAVGLLMVNVPVLAESDNGGASAFVGDAPVLAAETIVKGDYFTSGDVVRISGTVNGDLYASGGQVEVDGNVNGDVLVAGGQVVISGQVTQDVRVAGGDVILSGNVGKNITVAGGTVNLARKGKIRGSVVAMAGELNVASEIGGDLKAGAGNLVIGNSINGDVEASAENIRITDQAKIRGDVSYLSAREADINRQSAITGEVSRMPLPQEFDMERGFNIIGILVSLVSVFIIGILMVSFYPYFTRSAIDTLVKRPVASFLWGVLAVIVTPILAFLLTVSLIGLPMGLMLLAIYFIYLYLAKIFVAVWAGDQILKNFTKKVSLVWSLILGLVIYFVIVAVPGVKFFVGFVVTSFGVGMSLIARKELMAKLRKKKMV